MVSSSSGLLEVSDSIVSSLRQLSSSLAQRVCAQTGFRNAPLGFTSSRNPQMTLEAQYLLFGSSARVCHGVSERTQFCLGKVRHQVIWILLKSDRRTNIIMVFYCLILFQSTIYHQSERIKIVFGSLKFSLLQLSSSLG